MADGDIRVLDREAFRLGLAVDELEALYLQTDGVATAETDALERFIAESSRETIEALCVYLSEIQAREEYGKREAERLFALQERLEKRKAWVMKLIRGTLDKLEVRKLEVGTWTVSIRQGNPMALPAETTEPLPAEYQRVVPARVEPDKQIILRALKADKPVPGWILGRSAERIEVK